MADAGQTHPESTIAARLRPAAWRAAALWVFDALVLGQGGIAVVTVLWVLLLGLPAAALRRRYAGARRLRLTQLGLYLLAAVAVLATLAAHQALAQHRAQRVISAVQAYQAQHQRYPQALDDLVPAHLPRVPLARYTLLFNDFRYVRTDSGAFLYYVAIPPHGRPSYDFAAGAWTYVD